MLTDHARVLSAAVPLLGDSRKLCLVFLPCRFKSYFVISIVHTGDFLLLSKCASANSWHTLINGDFLQCPAIFSRKFFKIIGKSPSM